MTYLIPLALTAVAAAVTYLTCIRPMLRGHDRHDTVADPAEPDTAAEIRRLREEAQLLRRQLDQRAADATREQPGR